MLPAADRPGAPAGRPIVLALDTTAGRCSVALGWPGGGLVRRLPMVHGHSRHLLRLVDEVLLESGFEPGSVEAIGFGCGPGSFTGLRIACGVAQGLGFGWGRPLVPVDAMRTLALQAVLAHDGPADRVLVALDLRMGEVCCAAFDAGPALRRADWTEPTLGPTLASAGDAAALFEALAPARSLLAGDGFDAHPALRARVGSLGPRPDDAAQPDAFAVARLAAAGLALGRAVDAADAAPTYLRDKVALDVDEQAALRAARVAGSSR